MDHWFQWLCMVLSPIHHRYIPLHFTHIVCLKVKFKLIVNGKRKKPIYFNWLFREVLGLWLVQLWLQRTRCEVVAVLSTPRAHSAIGYSMPFRSIWLAAISMTLMMNAMAKAQIRLFLTHVWRFFFLGWTGWSEREEKRKTQHRGLHMQLSLSQFNWLVGLSTSIKYKGNLKDNVTSVITSFPLADQCNHSFSISFIGHD